MKDWLGYSGKSGTDPANSGLLDMVLNAGEIDTVAAVYCS